MNDVQGEAETLPLPAVKVKKDWPMLLATALRESHWELVNLPGGRLYSKVDPLRVLVIGGRYELSHRHHRQAMQDLHEELFGRVRAYLHRDAKEVVESGELRLAPPPMHPKEAQAFNHLWRSLSGVLVRLPPHRQLQAQGVEQPQDTAGDVPTAAG